MRHHEVREVMTADPPTVTPATPLKYVAEILVRQQVSAVPVLSPGGKVIGVVGEADLLRKEELQREPDGWHALYLSYRARRDIVTAETAGEMMSAVPATVRPSASVAEAARLMDQYGVTCLPVVDESGKLVGVVGPRNLLRVLLRPDDEIRAEIVNDVLVGYLATNPALVQVEVTNGVVRLAGELEARSMLALIGSAIRAVEGVIDVQGELGYAIDDTRPLPAPERDQSPLTRGPHPPVASRRPI
ncbi:MAG TPA: CBS domain-containing protein [Streptosporangiaceae bacterium]|nr:CBS domain-containing protein [Streptosporangiaceae bacterium]